MQCGFNKLSGHLEFWNALFSIMNGRSLQLSQTLSGCFHCLAALLPFTKAPDVALVGLHASGTSMARVRSPAQNRRNSTAWRPSEDCNAHDLLGFEFLHPRFSLICLMTTPSVVRKSEHYSVSKERVYLAACTRFYFAEKDHLGETIIGCEVALTRIWAQTLLTCTLAAWLPFTI